MRISSGYRMDVLNRQVSQAGSMMFAAQQKVLTGKRFQSAHEDPLATGQILNAQGLAARVEQLDRGLSTAKEHVGLTEQSLGDLGEILNRAKSLALQGNNATTDPAARQALATQVKSLMDRVEQLGNTRDSQGRYIFSGQDSDKKSFTAANGSLTFNGDTLPLNVEVRPGETMRTNMTRADQVFGESYAMLERLRGSLVGGQVSDSIAELTAFTPSVLAERGEAGTKMQTIDRQKEINSLRLDDLKTRLAELQDVDVTEAIADYQQADTAYRAALSMMGRATESSLMDFLR